MVSETPPEGSEVNEADQSVRFHHGDYLLTEETVEVTRANPSRIVLVAGPVSSGKTTLFASIYSKFQQGPFAEMLFAGSRTLLAFERICFPSRIESARAIAETTRTTHSPRLNFLHLGLRHASLASQRRDLLLPDVSGELFAEIENSADACRELALLSRADTVAVLIDAGRLTDVAQRQGARSSADSFLRRCIESGMLGAQSNVDIVITKWDLFVDSEDNQQFIDETKRSLGERYGEQVASLGFWTVAARPSPNTLESGFGVDALLQHWLEAQRTLPTFDYAPPKIERSFDLFLDARVEADRGE